MHVDKHLSAFWQLHVQLAISGLKYLKTIEQRIYMMTIVKESLCDE